VPVGAALAASRGAILLPTSKEFELKTRYLKMAALSVLGTAAVAAATDVSTLPAAVEWYQAEDARSVELAARESLVRGQVAATDDLVARVAAGTMTLAEAVDQLEQNTRNRPVVRDGLASQYRGESVRGQLALYLVDRVGGTEALAAEARAVGATTAGD
jgi:ABC-type branched-subunit amino acid transport system substrate-binding protein